MFSESKITTLRPHKYGLCSKMIDLFKKKIISDAFYIILMFECNFNQLYNDHLNILYNNFN